MEAGTCDPPFVHQQREERKVCVLEKQVDGKPRKHLAPRGGVSTTSADLLPCPDTTKESKGSKVLTGSVGMRSIGRATEQGVHGRFPPQGIRPQPIPCLDLSAGQVP